MIPLTFTMISSEVATWGRYNLPRWHTKKYHTMTSRMISSLAPSPSTPGAGYRSSDIPMTWFFGTTARMENMACDAVWMDGSGAKIPQNIPGFKICDKCVQKSSGWWLTYPSEKWWAEEQLGWWNSQLTGQIKFLFQTTNQSFYIRFMMVYEMFDMILHLAAWLYQKSRWILVQVASPVVFVGL